MDKETGRRMLTTHTNTKKCAKIVPKNLPVLSQQTNTNAQTHPVLTIYFPV